MRLNDLGDEACSFARTVGVIGDPWTLLILRDCFLRVRQFEEFQSRLGVSRGILADRLERLVANFVLTKVAYQERPLRYEYRLTPKGLALYPIIISLVHWGDVHLVGKKGRPILHQHRACQKVFDPVLTCSECGESVDPHDVEVLLGPGAEDPKHLPLGMLGSTGKPVRGRGTGSVAKSDRPASKTRVLKTVDSL